MKASYIVLLACALLVAACDAQTPPTPAPTPKPTPSAKQQARDRLEAIFKQNRLKKITLTGDRLVVFICLWVIFILAWVYIFWRSKNANRPAPPSPEKPIALTEVHRAAQKPPVPPTVPSYPPAITTFSATGGRLPPVPHMVPSFPNTSQPSFTQAPHVPYLPVPSYPGAHVVQPPRSKYVRFDDDDF